MALIRAIDAAVEKRREEITELARILVRTPSPTGRETAVATILKRKMEIGGYSETFVDRVGNVVGIIRGTKRRRSLLYNGHMDHVLPGKMNRPYSGEILDGSEFGLEGPVIYGRGIVDMKGALAAMVIAGAVLRDMNRILTGDLIVAGTVFEENLGNVGPSALMDLDGLRPTAALIGECTDLDLAHGNRGVVRTTVITHGKSCHVSVQERGVNALYKMARFIEKIQEANEYLPNNFALGKASWAICKLNVSPNAVNVVPDVCEAEVDTRTIPGFTLQQTIDAQQRIIDTLRDQDSEFSAEVSCVEKEIETWTGYKTKVNESVLPFYINPQHWLVRTGIESIKNVLGRQPALKIWGFTTECCCLTERNVPTIGFGPGKERFVHCNNEVLSIEDLISATKVYVELALRVCGVNH